MASEAAGGSESILRRTRSRRAAETVRHVKVQQHLKVHADGSSRFVYFDLVCSYNAHPSALSLGIASQCPLEQPRVAQALDLAARLFPLPVSLHPVLAQRSADADGHLKVHADGSSRFVYFDLVCSYNARPSALSLGIASQCPLGRP